MAKFVKFKIANNNATLAVGGDYSRDVLVNVDDIENVADVVAAGNYSVSNIKRNCWIRRCSNY